MESITLLLAKHAHKDTETTFSALRVGVTGLDVRGDKARLDHFAIVRARMTAMDAGDHVLHLRCLPSGGGAPLFEYQYEFSGRETTGTALWVERLRDVLPVGRYVLQAQIDDGIDSRWPFDVAHVS